MVVLVAIVLRRAMQRHSVGSLRVGGMQVNEAGVKKQKLRQALPNGGIDRGSSPSRQELIVLGQTQFVSEQFFQRQLETGQNVFAHQDAVAGNANRLLWRMVDFGGSGGRIDVPDQFHSGT